MSLGALEAETIHATPELALARAERELRAFRRIEAAVNALPDLTTDLGRIPA